MPLWSERRRLAEQAAREAAGEDLWVPHLTGQLRAKLYHLAKLCASDEDEGAFREFNREVQRIVQIQVGMVRAPSIPEVLVGHNSNDTDLALTYIEAVDLALHNLAERPSVGWAGHEYYGPLWREIVPSMLSEHRAKYKFVDGQIIPLESEELFSEVIEPAVELLRGRPDLADANSAYREGIRELQRGNAGNAITDVGTALQETLEALGCEGNALGPLINDARRRGLLAPHDGTLASGIQKFLDWVSADRSQTGDAHSADAAVLDDAWLAVHIVGALILRLAGSPRGEAAP